MGKNGFTGYVIRKYKTEPNIILMLVKGRKEHYDLFSMAVNGQHIGDVRHLALRSGRVDGDRSGLQAGFGKWKIRSGRPRAGEREEDPGEKRRYKPVFERQVGIV